jgi:dihydropteroate synthase
VSVTGNQEHGPEQARVLGLEELLERAWALFLGTGQCAGRPAGSAGGHLRLLSGGPMEPLRPGAGGRLEQGGGLPHEWSSYRRSPGPIRSHRPRAAAEHRPPIRGGRGNDYDWQMGGGQFLWRAGPYELDCAARTHVMGIINVTPDSFSDGGLFFHPEVAVALGLQMVADGADILDVGGESTRPGSEPVPEDEELNRVVPVIKRLAAEIRVPISVDTRHVAVAQAAVDVGASIVNDVSAGSEPGMFEVARDAEAGMVLMHMRGEPNTMQQLTDYQDVVGEVKAYLAARVEAAITAGLERECLAVDPGLGFAKTEQQNFELMRDIASFIELGRPLLVGPSRKSFIGKVLSTEVGERVEGTAGAVAWLAGQGAHVVRVHDVKEMVRVARVVDTIRQGGQLSVVEN